MYTFLTVLIIIVCILLVLAVLMQSSKGGGLASGFSGGTQIMGVRKTADFIEKATWYLAIALVVLCLATNFTKNTPTGAKAEQSAAQKKALESGPVSSPPTQNQAPAGNNNPATPSK